MKPEDLRKEFPRAIKDKERQNGILLYAALFLLAAPLICKILFDIWKEWH